MKIYVACLSSYNNGHLHGQWIEASSDPEEMQEAVNAMLKASPMDDAEEWAIHDYDDDAPVCFGEMTSLKTIAEYVEMLEGADDEELVRAVVEDTQGDLERAKGMLEEYRGTYGSFSDYADALADEMMAPAIATGGEKRPMEFLVRYFDYDAWARDLRHDYTVLDVPGGVAVFAA